MAVISLPRVRHENGGARPLTAWIGATETTIGRIQLTIYRDFKAIGHHWRLLQSTAACVPAQSFEQAEAWSRIVSQPVGTMPAIVCGRSGSGEIQFIWPFEVTRTLGLGCLRWIGQDHANYNMGLHSLAFARQATADDISTLLGEAAGLIGDVSAAHFEHQPFDWDGIPNPMARLPHSQSANTGHSILLEKDFDTLYRNRFSGKSRNTLKRKERRLGELGEIEIGWAKTPDERRGLVSLFFEQKRRQFAEQGITDAFAEPRIHDFYHEIAALPSSAYGSLDAGYLKVGGQTVAISCGVFCDDRFSTLLTSIDTGPTRKFSPGTMLLRHQIKTACVRGLNFFDMGAGDAHHKGEWCDVTTQLFENFIALEERGYLLTLPLAAVTAAKRNIKTRPGLWAFAQSVRRNLFGERRPKELPETA
ncbi:MAG TPA: GNAT family N-acetyltransferase [Rhizobiales bacterium]|nr:hypothetical protein BMS3Bbin10_00808 [bacterium BMS3Bbin10]HDO51899.1 GNAT family N-acetyltransferase [Hyphomicrobiales bacterium]